MRHDIGGLPIEYSFSIFAVPFKLPEEELAWIGRSRCNMHVEHMQPHVRSVPERLLDRRLVVIELPCGLVNHRFI